MVGPWIPRNPYIIVSAEGRFKLQKDNYIWREMTAELHGPVPQATGSGS